MRTLFSSSLALALTAACATEPSAPPPEDMDPPEVETPSIQLQLGADRARVIRGRAQQLGVMITRKGDVTGDITVVAEDLPFGVTAQPLTIPAGQTRGTLELAADVSIELGTYATATIRATSGALESALPLDMHLTDPPGALDVTFGLGGTSIRGYTAAHNEITSQLAIQPDGKILVAGVDTTAQGFYLARYDERGDLDPGFASGGVLAIPDGNASLAAVGLHLRTDGTILFVVASGSSNGIVYAIDGTGMLASSYGGSGAAVLSQAVLGISFTPGGSSMSPDGSLTLGASGGGFHVVRLTPSGELDTTFDQDGLASMSLGPSLHSLRGIAVRPDGRVVLAGVYWGQHSSYAVAQLTATGALDPSFSDDGKLVLDAGVATGFEDVTLLPDGRLALPGFRQSAMQYTIQIAMLKPDGQLDTSFGGDGFADVAMSSAGRVIGVDGGLVAIGSLNSGTDAAVAKLRMDGSPDDVFGPNGVASANMTNGAEWGYGLARDAQDRLVVASYSVASGELGQICLARFWQ